MKKYKSCDAEIGRMMTDINTAKDKHNQEWIERRIKDEYRKHKTLDWARLASIKIWKEIKYKNKIGENNENKK